CGPLEHESPGGLGRAATLRLLVVGEIAALVGNKRCEPSERNGSFRLRVKRRHAPCTEGYAPCPAWAAITSDGNKEMNINNINGTTPAAPTAPVGPATQL